MCIILCEVFGCDMHITQKQEDNPDLQRISTV